MCVYMCVCTCYIYIYIYIYIYTCIYINSRSFCVACEASGKQVISKIKHNTYKRIVRCAHAPESATLSELGKNLDRIPES